MRLFFGFCLLLLMGAPLLAADFPGEFVQNPGGNLALAGLPGYRSTPARQANPGFGFLYADLEDVEERVFGASAEFGSGNYRVGFLGAYQELDSVYRQVYTEWDFSLCNTWAIFGIGYGLDIGWIPEMESWANHRYKAGISFYGWNMAVSGMVSGWKGEFLENLDYSVGLALNPGGRLSAFVEWDGVSSDVGTSVLFELVRLDIVYRFPEFGVGASLEISFGNWFMQGVYGFSGSVWRWLGGAVGRQISK